MQKHVNLASSLDDSVLHLLHCAWQRGNDLFADEVGESHLAPRQFVVLAAVGAS